MTNANKFEVNAAEPATIANDPWLGSAWFPQALSVDGNAIL